MCSLSANWNELHDTGSGAGGETWWVYPRDPLDQNPTHAMDDLMNFGLSRYLNSAGMFHDGRRGVPRFAAGTSLERGKVKLSEEARSQLRTQGFEFQRVGDGMRWGQRQLDYIWRLAYPEDVLAGSSIEAQGHALGRWAIESFALARAALVDEASAAPTG
jgi:hypothetical protein